MEIAPGIRRLGTGVANVYLIEDAGAITIIDAGMAGYWGDLHAELAAMGRSIEDVRSVVLRTRIPITSGSPSGSGATVRCRSGLHEQDAALARGEAKQVNEGGGPVRPLPLLRFLVFGLRHGGLRTTHLTEVATFGDGTTLDVPGAPRVIHVPGHTPGSAAFHLPSRDAIFVGDAFVTLNVMSGQTGPRLFPNFNTDNKQAFASLARFDAIEATTVLPGHGDPWTNGLAEAVRLVRLGGPPA